MGRNINFELNLNLIMKHTIRQQIAGKRNSLAKEEISNKSSKIKNNLYSLPEFKSAKNILFYVSLNSEVDTKAIIKEQLSKKGKKIIVPYVKKGNQILQLSEIKNLAELEPKAFGILEPKSEFIRKFDPNKLDLILIPGIAFDMNGHRIGYGYGYYDRFLKKLKSNAKKIGLALDFQVVEKIAESPHDIPVDYIITEKRIIKV